MRRRSLLSCFLAALLVSPVVIADEEVAVPIALQMELLLKVAAYDKNMPARVPELARLLIVSKKGDGQSTNAAQQAQRALSGKLLVGRAIEVSTLTFADGPALAARVKEKGVAIVYVAPGFERA